jgi:uncharacterized protein YbbC (DUF1343 family)
VKVAHDLYGNEFKWKEPPYEYELERNPFDVIAGTTALRKQIEQGASLASIVESWQPELEKFRGLREEYLLY